MNVLRAAGGPRPAVAPGIFGWLLVAGSAWETNRVFDSDYRPTELVVATAVAALTALAVSPLIWQLRFATYTLVTIALTAAVTATVGRPSPVDLVVAVTRAPLHGFGDLAAAVWPSPALAAGVAAFALITVAAACLATDFSLRRRGGAALFPPLVILTVIALLSAEAGPPSLGSLLAFVLVTLALLRSQRPHRQSNVSVGFVLAMVVLIGSVPILSARFLPADRFDPRANLDGRAPTQGGVSPLSRVNLWRGENPESVLFTSDLVRASRWRLVGLTAFDGREWLPADDYRVSGNIVRIARPGLATTKIDVSLGSLTSPWLPTPDRAVRVSRSVEVDKEYSGLLVNDGDLPPGTSYELITQPRTATPAEIAAGVAAPATSPFIDSFELPVALQRLAQSIVADAVSDADRAEQIASFLRESFVLDPSAAPGHSLAVIDLFLETTRRGTDEQFVSAFGLLAAAAGLPVRISVGFETVPDPSGKTNGTVALSSAATAWPEIKFVDLGWVAFDPVPTEANQQPSTPQGGSTGPAEVLDSPPPPVTAPAVVEASVDDVEPAQPPAQPTPDTNTVDTTLIVMFVIVTLLTLGLLVYVIAVLAIKQRRMQRRTQLSDPRARVLAAFRSGIDVVVDLGGDASRARTDRELVMTGSSVVADTARSLAPVARTATAAVFAPELVIDDGHADEAWKRVHEFQRAAARRVGARRALRARLSLRSLRRGLPDD